MKKMKEAARVLAILCCSLLAMGQSVPDSAMSPCNTILSQWLSNLHPVENPENASLTVQWNGLGQRLAESDCLIDNLSLELWRVDQHSQRPHDFGTQAYFSAYERCNKLEPEHFIFHSAKFYQSNETQVLFRHTVEEEYMFRICPCHRRRHQGVSCDCQFENALGKPQCSRIHKMKPEPESKVMPWCLTGPAVLPHVGTRVEEVRLKSMLMNCTHLLVAGTMASCTPIQSYDHVLLTFHKLENDSSQTCWEHRDFGTHNPVKVISRLYSQNPYVKDFSHGMGDFTAIVGLSADSSYCVQLEHLKHPYCMREITISHSSTYRMPRVCSVHMAKPITTAICSPPPTNVVTQFNFTHDPIFVAMILALVVVVVIAAIYVTRRCIFNNRRKKTRLTAENEPMISKILTVDGSLPCSAEAGGVNPHTQVFLLHFLRDDEEEARCTMLREWIQSLAHVVHDIEDEDMDEQINQDPEGWVLDRLCQPEMRVVLVASRSVSQLLRSSVSPEMSSGSCSTTTSTDGGSQSLSSDCGSDGVSPMGSTPEDEEFTKASDENLDSRSNLRAFALKHIQAHLAGNYRQLVVVSFDKHCPFGDSVAERLTPNKNPLVLPHHLSDLQHWITSGQVKPSACCRAKIVRQTKELERPPVSL